MNPFSRTPRERAATVPVVEERLSVDKRLEETGAVRVRVESEVVEAPCDLSTTHEEVEVQHVAVGRLVERRREPWLDGDTTVVPVYEEVLMPRLVLREEIRLVRRRSTVREQGSMPLRRERAVVERRQADGSWRPDPMAEPAPDAGGGVMDGGGRETQQSTFDVPTPQECRTMRQTVVGVFDRYAAAQQAARVLEDSGFDHDHVHVTGADDDDGDGMARATRERERERDDEGVMGTIRNFFSDLFGPDDKEEVGTYAEAVRRGGAVVKVEVEEEAEADKAREALQQAGAVDIDERVGEWRASGWNPGDGDGRTGYGSADTERDASLRTSSPGYADARDERTERAEGTIPVLKEELSVGKRTVGTGGVRVYSRVVETPVEESVELKSEHAQVERRPVDRPATDADLSGLRDKTIEVRETAEKPVVEKTARVVEEVSVDKTVDRRTETVRDTVRNTEVEVEKLSGRDDDLRGRDTALRGRDEALSRRAFDDYDTEFRSDFDTRYAASGARYDEYQPAYRYGWDLASDRRYAGREWDDIETDARRDWEQRHPGSAWERFKASVRHAWERATR